MAAAGAAFRGAADPARAAAMSAYMRGRFPFLGIPRPERARLERPLLAGLRMREDDLARAVDACWALPEREFQYLGCVLLQRHAGRLPAGAIGVVERCITARSWWDTVDHLASRVVGPMVRAHPGLADVMDDWAGRDDVWLARTAIIHQLGARQATDADRLFGYCALRAGDTDVFIRKGIGWALRQYARTDPDAVRAFVAAHRDVLSPLSVREATKHL
ncbi:MAG: DNA alkylation repair protein [Thermoleophilia bacterium]|nr:DNA alkylation repair protein [Thermoleophilia bacterium]